MREVHLGCGARLIAGIHFRGLDLGYPFVGVFAQSRWLTDLELLAAHQQLLATFSVFEPKASWWWLPSDRLGPDVGAREYQIDQVLVAGRLDQIRTRPPPALPSGWTCRQLTEAATIFTDYQALYALFHRARPELARAVPCESDERLQACADAGGLFGFFDGPKLSGLVATEPSRQLGCDFWWMIEVVLAQQHTGKGLGPMIQRATLDRLDAQRALLVGGTIAHQNLPSRRSAAKVGRIELGQWFFLKR